MDPNSKVRRNPKIVSSEIAAGEESVLLHLDTTAYHSLNKVGNLIWRLLEEPISVGELVERLEDEFDEVPVSLETDTQAFLADLAARDLLIVEP